jgi:hypothetical protein
MAWDPQTKQMLLFGGDRGTVNSSLGDTWAWSGGNWTHLHPATSLGARNSASMAWDPQTKQMLLFGGDTNGPGTGLADTWMWTGTDWKKLSPSLSPPARWRATMAADPQLGGLVLFGGFPDGGPPTLGDTWLWKKGTWNLLANTGPAPRADAVSAFDSSSKQFLLFGGWSGTADVTDTWLLRPGT